MGKYDGVTPLGKIYYAHLLSPAVITRKDGTKVNTGKYVVLFELEGKDKQDFIDTIRKAWIDHYASTHNGEMPTGEFFHGIAKVKDKEYFRFQMTAHVKTKDGEEFDFKPALFDRNLGRLERSTEPGNGSTGRISFQLYPFETGLKKGVSLRFQAVQFDDIKERGQLDGAYYGFHKIGSSDNSSDEDEALAQMADIKGV